ncbi:MAG: phosphoribosylformylglycinamidine synthase subunit PurS [Alphaproteobacteria bacterium]|jgi:phosphoribosylformylglycinamidine synthase PurS subunit|tara:strand:- start:2935 stop:3177 length:243 start_codon:yes stop_codon:yes gene_type:complete
MIKVTVYITLKKDVLDPQGKAIHVALNNMGFDKINGVRQGKLIEIDLDAKDHDQAKEQVKKMSEQLLANPIIEDYSIELE